MDANARSALAHMLIAEGINLKVIRVLISSPCMKTPHPNKMLIALGSVWNYVTLEEFQIALS